MEPGFVLLLLVGTWYLVGAIMFALLWYYELRHTVFARKTGEVGIVLVLYTAITVSLWPRIVDWKAVKLLFWGKMPGRD